MAKEILNNLAECDVAEVQITYKIDLEKELKDIKGNIGSLKAAKDKIDMILELTIL